MGTRVDPDPHDRNLGDRPIPHAFSVRRPSSARRRRISTRVPPPWGATTSNSPPHRSVSSRAIASPRPDPPAGAPGPRWKRSVTTLRSDSAMPGPWSRTATTAVGPRGDLDLNRPRRVDERVVDQVVEDLIEVSGIGAHAGRPVGGHREGRPRSPARSCQRSIAAVPDRRRRPRWRHPPRSHGRPAACGPRYRPCDRPRGRRHPACRRSSGSSLPSAARSIRSFMPVSGVRSWCEAFETKDRCASNVRSTRSAISSNEVASSRTSSGPAHGRLGWTDRPVRVGGRVGQPGEGSRQRPGDHECDEHADRKAGEADHDDLIVIVRIESLTRCTSSVIRTAPTIDGRPPASSTIGADASSRSRSSPGRGAPGHRVDRPRAP